MRTISLAILFLFLAPVGASSAPKANVPGAEVLSDIAFLPTERTEKLDLYLPAERHKQTKLPLVIFVHGGGWAQGDKVDARSDNIGTVLVGEGYAVASINYKLAPGGQGSYHGNLKASFPQNLQDVKSAVRFLRRNAAKYTLDPDRIALMGASAGAHLAVLSAYTDPAAGFEPKNDGLGETSSRVNAVVGLYGAYDWPVFQRKHIKTEEDAELARKASPGNYVSAATVPTFLIHGTKDIYVRHGETESLSKVLAEKKVPNQTIIVPGAPHSFDFRLKQHNLKADLLPFLAEHLKPNQ